MSVRQVSERLRERLVFERPRTADDEQGGREDGWVTAFHCRGHYKRLRGGEQVIASRLEGTQITVIRIRNSSKAKAVDTDYKATDLRTNEIFNIRTNIESDDRRWRELTCQSGVAV